MGLTIAIGNQKGGVAKTTTCISLGAALVEMGQSVLLVDLDPQANLTLSFKFGQTNPSGSGAAAGQSRPGQSRRGSVMDALTGTSSLRGVSRETEFPGLHVVPAGRELAVVDKVFYQLPGYHYRLRQALDGLEPGLYDYVLVDCPPSAATLTLNALTASDLLIIPVQCEPYAARSVGQMIRLVHQVWEQYNDHLEYRVLITMYDMRNRISQMIRQQIEGGMGAELFQTMIQIDTKLRESPAYGQPITNYASRSRAAEQYRALAQELQSPEMERLLDRGTAVSIPTREPRREQARGVPAHRVQE